jgi:hypothetical protein
MNRPELFIVGAMKSGSSYLHKLLGSHPAIFMSEPKEPTYFVDQDLLRRVLVNPWDGEHSASEAAYLALFESASSDQICGESSQNYSRYPQLPGVPERIFRFCPNARIVYIMRDPVERALSHYWYSVQQGAESRSSLEALKYASHYIDQSLYAMQLDQYRAIFPADQIYTISFELLRDEPLHTIQCLFAWLGVDSSHVPPSIGLAANVTGEVMRQRSGFLEELRRTSLYQKFRHVAPTRLKSVARSLSESEVNKASIDVGEARRYLVDTLRGPTLERLEDLGIDTSFWTTTLT